MSNQPSGLFTDKLKLVSYCPACGGRSMDAKVLGENEDSHLMHVTCTACAHAVITLVLTGGGGMSSVGLMTDLTYEDALRFGSSSAVNIDDVIEMHTFLESDAWKQFLPKKVPNRVKNVTK